MKPYTIAINSSNESIKKARKRGYITTGEFQNATGISDRRIGYWHASGVFGAPIEPGSGHRRMWHTSVIPIAKVLNELALEMGKYNNTSTALLKRIVSNYDNGQIQFSDHIILRWENNEQ